MKKLALTIILLLSTNCWAATKYITPAGAGSKDGTDWANAFGISEWKTDLSSVSAGDVYYIAGGTYTLDENWSFSSAGTSTSPIYLIGVKSGTTAEPPTTSDYAYNTDRPLISAGSYRFWLNGAYWRFYNLRVTGTSDYLWRTGAYVIVQNCYSYNSSETADYEAFCSGAISQLTDCEFISTNGIAANMSNTAWVMNCYFYASKTGFRIGTNNANKLMNCIISNCTTGILVTSGVAQTVLNSTIYNCTTGISMPGSTAQMHCFNSIISDCTTGVNATGGNYVTNVFNYNCWNNTTDVVNVTKGANDITANPQFENAANGDFRLKPTSPCLNTGKPTLGGGKTTIGAWQPASYESVPSGDLNNDFKVDFYDFAQMALNWLIDCTTDPNNPACVPD